MRKEQDILGELAALCTEPGYVHAIAYFCFRDNIVKVGDQLKAKDLHNLVGEERLIRTEISTLIGLTIRGAMDLSLPPPATLQRYIGQTESLLGEIHKAMTGAWFVGLTPEKMKEKEFNPFTAGEALREPIFYGGESAYGFQYRDFSVQKYVADDQWIRDNKGFSIKSARDVVKAICDLQGTKLPLVHEALINLPPDQWTLLPGFEFSAKELSRYSGIDEQTVELVVQAFALPERERNAGFRSLGDFNAASAFPLLRAGPNSFLLLQQYSLLEALYEAPYYWMTADHGYVSRAMEHRGRFTEDLSKDRLLHVFGAKYVFTNVDIYESKGKRIGEIDVLVLFGDRAIVLQAKSKRLTLEARKGNDLRIKDDFKKGVQDSYDQGVLCAKALGASQYKFVPAGSDPIAVPTGIEEVYIFCVVSDHYPALAFQARQFLRFEASDRIAPPFVMDVFTLDAMTEMLPSPLRFLSYVNRRTRYTDQLLATHELTILSYHLKRNLWLHKEYDMFLLSEDISVDLDVAMMARREHLPGRVTPDGVLTRLSNTALGRLIDTIERSPRPATISLGFFLLTLGEDSVREISAGIDATVDATRRDHRHHDFTVAVGDGDTGLTVHCNDDPSEIAGPRLQSYCERRKYAQKAGSWFGICLSPADGASRFGVSLKSRWEHNEAMEASTRRMAKPGKIADLLNGPRETRKLSRNDPCPCGSGKKYKRCCLR